MGGRELLVSFAAPEMRFCAAGLRAQDGRAAGGQEAGRLRVAPGGHLPCPWSLAGVALRAMFCFYATNKRQSISEETVANTGCPFNGRVSTRCSQCGVYRAGEMDLRADDRPTQWSHKGWKTPAPSRAHPAAATEPAAVRLSNGGTDVSLPSHRP